MKVLENPGVMLDQIRRQNTVKDQGENTFHQIMEDVELEKGFQEMGRSPAASGMIPEGVQILNQTGSIQNSEIVFGKAEILRDLEQTLDLVDFYAGRLADPSFQANEMEPLVDHLEERMAGFQMLQTEAELPEKLRNIISDTVLTLGRETAKFRRGDYS
ncbi:MAG: hypothetical protein CVU57_00640 [Deltaproteobacteria bacterium HGW-Deltaproteobacteria-15]|jgi:hypothetical protein|nr:MAG: hypothetical protein CVU57_00640 [Deltaproteobacteria bacterium HGW-Deltaproteobacteria-15]